MPVESMNEPLWYKDAVFYVVDVRSFDDRDGDGLGDFRGLTSRLDYCRDLGVTGLCLLPFYPSPLRDDGFDIADHRAVDPRLGNVRDVKAFLRAAHVRGLRVLVDLVLDNTAIEHNWFQRSRIARAGTSARNFYIWSDRPDKYRGAPVLRFESEQSNWAWDEKAGAFYWHRSAAHQPALNYDNPAVLRRMISVMAYWLKQGVDGFRLHGVSYIVAREGTACADLPETHALLKRIRRLASEAHPQCVLAGVVDAWPEDSARYFGDGDECHIVQFSSLSARLFMMLAREDRFPLVEFLSKTPAAPEHCQWGSMLRDHDALSLFAMTEEEREYMRRVFSPNPRARHNFGVRRRLMPMLDNDERRARLMYGLLFSLPGAPMLYYGDEIGMGDNIYLPECSGLRTPMQWSSDRNAGFSRAEAARLHRPLVSDSPGGFQAVNVEMQLRIPSSLLAWLRKVISCRERHKALSRGSLTILVPSNPKVLAFVRRDQDEAVLCVANLSRAPGSVELDLSAFEGGVPIDLLSRTYFPPIGKLPYLMTLGPYEFQWHSLTGVEERISCFISYSSRDEELAEKLVRDLEEKSIVCWKAPGDLSIGESFRERIELTVRRCDRLVVILSKDALASEWVKLEVETALQQERLEPERGSRVFPVRTDDAVYQSEVAWANACNARHIGDFRVWQERGKYEAAFDKLLSVISMRHTK